MCQLSRLLITEHINENTPICVLIEIADAHGITYDQKDIGNPNFSYHLMEAIHHTHVPVVGEQMLLPELKDKTEWRYVARFVNKHSQWPQSKLIEAYNFLIGFMDKEDPLNKIPLGFKFGSQTPENIKSINACVLYKICAGNRLNTHSRTTINQMAYAVRMLRESVESLIRRSRQFIDHDANRIDLINVLMLSQHEIQDPDPPIINDDTNYQIIPKTVSSYEMLDHLHITLNNIGELQKKIEPSTEYGSTALAAINYGLDISKASNSNREYKILKLTGRHDYVPGDNWMRYWYQRNPDIFDLTIMFNPLFPSIYYDSNRLTEMVRSEGYTDREIAVSSHYELMQIAHITETFYMGEMPNMKSEETYIDLDHVDDVPYGELFCYGQKEGPLYPISIRELIGLFSNNQNFTNPFAKNAVFNSTSINKLKLLIQKPTGPLSTKRLTPETIEARNRLFDIIVNLELLTKITDEPTKQLGFTYRNSSPDTKNKILTTLTTLLHVGMYMRGWKGPGENYPVIQAPVSVDRQGEVFVNVARTIGKYEKLCRSLGRIGLQINNLPLVKYCDGHYQISTTKNDGITVGDRISIIKDGEDTSNISSCIRLSSNWICSSAHKYLIGIGQSPPFDIFNLRYIS